MPERNYLFKVTLPSGSEFWVQDYEAREMIAALQSYTNYLGVTTTELVDNVTTSPTITIAGESVTAKKGEIANYGSAEFIYNGSVWQEFGDLSALGALAFEDSATGSFTPAGTCSGANVEYTPTTDSVYSITDVGALPTFVVSDGNLTITAGTLPTKGSAQTVLTALGNPTITQPTFTGTAGTVTVSPAA